MTDIEHFTKALKSPPCPRCSGGRLVARDITLGKLKVACSVCSYFEWIEPPPIQKKIIYLDTGVLANMARAEQKGDPDDPLMQLYETLRTATALQVVICPASPITRQEYELRGEEGFDVSHRMAGQLGDPDFRHHHDVQRVQLTRALDRWLSGKPAVQETRPPFSDALYGNPHEWTPSISFALNWRSLPEWIEETKTAKHSIHKGYEKVKMAYEAEGLTYEDIRNRELNAFGQVILDNGFKALEKFRAGNADAILNNTFQELVMHTKEKLNCPAGEGTKTVVRFLKSEHPKSIPYARINAKLLAGLMVDAMGEQGRRLRASDSIDVEHIATYLPYVDAMIVDGYMARLATRNPLALQDEYGATIYDSKTRGIQAMTKQVERWMSAAPQAEAAKLLRDAASEHHIHTARIIKHMLEGGI